MSNGRQLYELQELDLEIEEKRKALSIVEGRLGTSEQLVEARAALERARERLATMERDQRSGEWEVDDLRTRAATLEEKLYGGSVKNPKELAGIQEQVDHLKKQRKSREDRVLDIMSEVEAAQSEVDTKSSAVERIEAEWRDEQDALSKERVELTRALAALEQRRGKDASRIDPAVIELYQSLRERRQGRAVAKVEQGMCQGCRIVLPMNELQRARTGQEIVQCSSCERILYLS